MEDRNWDKVLKMSSEKNIALIFVMSNGMEYYGVPTVIMTVLGENFVHVCRILDEEEKAREAGDCKDYQHYLLKQKEIVSVRFNSDTRSLDDLIP